MLDAGNQSAKNKAGDAENNAKDWRSPLRAEADAQIELLQRGIFGVGY